MNEVLMFLQKDKEILEKALKQLKVLNLGDLRETLEMHYLSILIMTKQIEGDFAEFASTESSPIVIDATAGIMDEVEDDK